MRQLRRPPSMPDFGALPRLPVRTLIVRWSSRVSPLAWPRCTASVTLLLGHTFPQFTSCAKNAPVCPPRMLAVHPSQELSGACYGSSRQQAVGDNESCVSKPLLDSAVWLTPARLCATGCERGKRIGPGIIVRPLTEQFYPADPMLRASSKPIFPGRHSPVRQTRESVIEPEIEVDAASEARCLFGAGFVVPSMHSIHAKGPFQSPGAAKKRGCRGKVEVSRYSPTRGRHRQDLLECFSRKYVAAGRRAEAKRPPQRPRR